MPDTLSSDVFLNATWGDAAAVCMIYRRYHLAIFHYLFYRVNSQQEAEDLTSGITARGDLEKKLIQSGDLVYLGAFSLPAEPYGFSNGVEYPISVDADEDFPEVPDWPHDERGLWSQDISAQILFFDPTELGAVALGKMEAWQPQPNATLTLDEYLFDPGFDFERGKRYLLGAAAFDRENDLLYIIERMADEDERSLVHVFRVE